MLRRNWGTLLKIGVTLVGLAYVLWQVPLREIGQILLGVNWPWLLVAILLITASLFLRAYRWLILLRGLPVTVGYGRLAELYFVGNFFNAFLPSGFGGDAVRVLEVAQDVPANVAAGTVIVDRLTGLLMLFLMALLTLPFRPPDFPDNVALAVAGVSAVGLIGGFVVLEGGLLRRFAFWMPGKLSPVGDGPVAKVLEAVQGCGWPAVGKALLISAGFNLLLAAWWAAAGKALGVSVPYLYYVLVIPILSVALLVPSVSGLGVRESLAPLLFAGAGLDAATAVALSLLVFVAMRVSSLFGAPIYIYSTLRRSRRPTTESG